MVVFDSIHRVEMPRTGGCAALGLFDGLHPGHRAVISAAVETARERGLVPWVFTFTFGENHPAAKPASGRLLSSARREQLLEQMGVTHMLCPPFEEFQAMAPEEYVRAILRDTLGAKQVFCGENYHFGRQAAAGVEDLRRLGGEMGIRVDTLPMVIDGGRPLSSSRIRECIARGEVAEAARLLGRPYAIDFEVIHGRRLGRMLHSPTINQALPETFVKPRFGVYATTATVEGRRRPAVTNVGKKPTVGSDRVLAETYILDYQGDLYGRRILVEFYDFIRPEEKFGSLEELRDRIHQDAEQARRMTAALL